MTWWKFWKKKEPAPKVEAPKEWTTVCGGWSVNFRCHCGAISSAQHEVCSSCGCADSTERVVSRSVWEEYVACTPLGTMTFKGNRREELWTPEHCDHAKEA